MAIMTESTSNILINASNLHVGGGIQVAVSFIDSLSRMGNIEKEIHVVVSSEVDFNLQQLQLNPNVFLSYRVIDVYGVSTLWSDFGKSLKAYDLIFTVFGPLYLLGYKGIQITGFAQAWIIYPENEAALTLSLLERVKTRLKFFIHSLFFSRADKLIVELEHVRKRLISMGITTSNKVEVVHNCLSSLYLDVNKWQPLNNNILTKSFSIGFVGRDYLHKNTMIFPQIKKNLFDKYSIDVDFYVTLSDEEWQLKSEDFRRVINNVGVLSVAQCPSFYKEMDAVIFPSLLECFSATPLEAMAMGKPLFASDRDFVRDVCGNYALYFDPMNPDSAADIIAWYIRNRAGCDQSLLSDARQYAESFSNAKQRAVDYVAIIQKMI